MNVLKFRVEILEMIARGAPLEHVAEHMCRFIDARFAGVACSMLTVDVGGTLHPLAAPSLPESYTRSLDNQPVGPNVGSCGTAAYLGKSVEVGDIAVDSRWTGHDGYRQEVLGLGYKACWSWPLVNGSGIVLATVALYCRDAREPTVAERSSIDACLHLLDLAFARHRRVVDRERRASTDALTRLPNQGSFAASLSHLTCAEPGDWAILLVDLDNLKIINDTFGHATGDRLLQTVAQRLSSHSMPDGVFRIGGDEFAVLIKDPARLHDLARAAADLRQVIAMPIVCDHFTIVPEATMGAAVVSGTESSPHAVHRNADFALYHAKETCRGGFVRFWPGIDTRMVARLSTLESVEAALREARIDAWYQPVIDMASQRIVGLEALCRMTSPGGDVLPAMAFADALSDARIAPVLTQRMLTIVSQDMRNWRDSGIDVGYVAVNVSAVDLRGGRLEGVLADCFADDDLMARLVIEVTETVYIGDRDRQVIDAVRRLRALGPRIALDDFGTGYASLTHLLDLPVDFIKIDQSFTRRLPGDEVSATIVSGLVAIAGKLGALVTVEGVETADQAALLGELGCEMGQGFHFSASVDRAEVARLLVWHGADAPHGIPMHGKGMTSPQAMGRQGTPEGLAARGIS